MSSGSAKSVSTQRSELDESFSSSASFPNSPATAGQGQPNKVGRPPVSINGVALQRQRQRDIYRKDFLSLSASTAASYHFRSRSQEALAPSVRTIPVRRRNLFRVYPWSSFVEGDEELVWPNVRSMYGMMSGECCITFSICHKHNSLLPLGRQKQPSSPSTKELRGTPSR